MADPTVNIKFETEGADKASTDLNDVAAAMANAETSAQGAESAINEADSAFSNLGENGPTNAEKLNEADFEMITANLMGLVALALEVSAALIAMTNGVAEQADAVVKGAQALNWSTDAYQEWDHILQKNGSSMKKAQSGITKLTSSISSGDKKASEALDALGLSMEELQGMKPEEQFAAVVSALQKIDDVGLKNDLASTLFGAGGAKNLGTLLTSTGEDVDALAQEAHALNLVMSEETLSAAADYKEAQETVQGALQGLKNELAEGIMPVITSVNNALTSLISDIDWKAFGEALGSALGPCVDFLNNFIFPLAKVSLQGVVATLSLLLKILGGLGEIGSNMFGGKTEVDTLLGEGLSVDELKERAEAAQIAYDAAVAAVEADSKGGTEVASIALIDQMNARAQELQVATEAYERAKKALEGGGETGGKTPTETGGETAPEQTNQQIQGAANEAETAALQMMQTYDEAAGTITSTFIQGTDEASQAAVESIENLNDTMALNMAELNNNAYIWGMDMMRLLANGIADGSNTYILPAIDQLTELIKSRLGYSEPSVGPLARTHTWMPDMMALLARGIRDSSWMVASALGEAFDLAPVLNARGGSSFNYGGVSVQIYAAPGQSVDELYNVFSYRLARDVADREAVFST